MKDFRQLKVWEKAHQMTLRAYRISASFPPEERYGLQAQVRRCCASIGANIAEGCGRAGDGDFHRFLQVAMGSASELDYHILLAKDLGYMNETMYKELYSKLDEIKRMLGPLIRKVQNDRSRSEP